MDEPLMPVTHHAVLIGVNSHVSRPLEGCVNDVLEVRIYLQSLSNPVELKVFTAENAGSSNEPHPVKDSQLWPTYNNVVSSLEDIIRTAKPGSFVYIHYSGHGTRIPPSHANNYSGDVALVLIDGEKGEQMHYLRGMELAYLVRRMSINGLLVTLVLDCCFSGGVARDNNPSSIRFLDYCSEIDESYPPQIENVPDGLDTAFRDGSMLPNWLVNPDSYTIFTACGPSEVAREITVGGKKKYGGLSYLLSRTLIKVKDLGRTQLEVYNDLCAIFRQHCPQQNPILYGKNNTSFFGPVVPESNASFSALKNSASIFHMPGGHAHGLSIGDTFSLRPFYARGDGLLKPSDMPVITRVTRTYPLTSDLELVNAPKDLCVPAGWTAHILTSTALRQYPIHFSSTLPNQDIWMELARQRPSLTVIQGNITQPYSFGISLDSGLYSVEDGSGNIIPNIPMLHERDENARKDLLGIIEHLSWFKHVESIVNSQPSATFRKSYHVSVETPLGDVIDSTEVITVNHNKLIILKLENKNKIPLYFYVYSLTSRWQIDHLFTGSYLTVPAPDSNSYSTGVMKKKLQMIISPDQVKRGIRESIDVIKVFVTTQPTSFATLEKPRIDVGVKKADADTSIFPTNANSGSEEILEDWFVINLRIRTVLNTP